MKARNPSTGTLETVYVKALDSMPVGTQVEYTGDTIPAGWEEVNDYSTTEIDTGKKWIDGKKIYRKVLTGTLNSTEYTVMTGVNTLNFISMSGWMMISSSVQQAIPSYANSNNYAGAFVVNTELRLVTPSAWNGATYTVIVEYTKTS